MNQLLINASVVMTKHIRHYSLWTSAHEKDSDTENWVNFAHFIENDIEKDFLDKH